jgi:hypothetical protein
MVDGAAKLNPEGRQFSLVGSRGSHAHEDEQLMNR